MKHVLWATLVASAFTANVAMASAELAKAKNCLVCHAMTSKLVGPAFNDIAARYADQKGAQDKLTKKVLIGGYGVWGAVPMPANPQVTEADARALVKWILSQ